MARRKRSRQDKVSGIAGGAGSDAASIADASLARGSAAALALPAETAGVGTAAIFALMMFLAPALGVPHEEMLQDTLKSIVVSFATLGAALLFFWA
jgi:O-antigen ligase